MIGALAFIASASAGYEWLTRDEITARMTDCGIQSLRIEYVELYQKDVVTIEDAEVSDQQIQCIAENFWRTFHDIEFEGSFLGQYLEAVEELARPEARRRAERYFADRPELGPPPDRMEGESNADLSARIERFCGERTEGAFSFEGGTTPSISSLWIEKALEGDRNKDLAEAFGCLMNAAFLADLPIGFIGNERESSDSVESGE